MNIKRSPTIAALLRGWAGATSGAALAQTAVESPLVAGILVLHPP